jgi:hypothetical protein
MQPSIQGVLGRPERERDYLLPFSADVKNTGAILPLLPIYSCGAQIKHMDNIYFALLHS